MPGPSPAEVVRLLFEACSAADVKRVCALLDPDIDAVSTTGVHYRGIEAARRYFAAEGADTQILGQRFEEESDGSVIARGRIRRYGRGSLADSPAAWRVTVRDGRVATVHALTGAVARTRAAA